MRTSLLACMTAALLAGCGSDASSQSSSAPTLSPPTLEIRHPLQRALNAQVQQLVVHIEDAQGRDLQAPQSFAPAASLKLNVDPQAVLVDIEYLGAGGLAVGSFRTQIDPIAKTNTVIDNPGWVDAESLDPTDYTFAISGCNRVDSGDVSVDNPSSANRAQLLADFAQVPTLNPLPRFFFFTGDLVTNLEPGTSTLVGQLGAWLALYASTPLARSPVTLVPLTGNHEVLLARHDPISGTKTEYPNPATLPVWVSMMGSFLKGNNGPTTAAPNPDQLTEDQSQLSYSFQDANMMFIILNTDTFIDATTLGDVPLNWLQQQLDAAQASTSVEHIFILAHKPIIAPDGTGEEPGPGSVRSEQAGPLQTLLLRYPKFRGYLCAHAHTWQQAVLDSGVKQVVAGNAGSSVISNFDKTGRGYFGFTLIKRHRSGTFSVESYGRPIPKPYDLGTEQPPATLRVLQQL